MTVKRKGRPGGHRATPKTSNSKYFITLSRWIKSTLTTLALLGVLPFCVAEWLEKKGGNQND